VNISLKTCLFLTLIVASLFASWRGVDASYAMQESSNSEDGVSSLHVDTPTQNNDVTETEKTESLALSSDVPLVFPNSISPSSRYSPDIADSKQQWALQQIHAIPSTWNVKNSSPVLVAVLDTGIDKNHEELDGRVVAEIDLSKSATFDDIYGHGTPIAGIIAADAENGLGMIGLAPESRLINVKVADDKGTCQISILAAGIIWAVDNGAKVINISIELKESTTELKNAVNYAWNNGAIVIAASGNDGNSLPVYPASLENCIGVTAIQENDTLAPLANYGDWVDVAAPGMDIYSTLPDNKYGYKHGTSFAAAYVSGLAALLFSMATDTNGDGKLNDEVRRAIEAGCDGIDIAGTGKGNINVANSVAELAVDPGYLR
jgi:thermitase